MTLGFTGTSRGMTSKQMATVRYLFTELQLTELHHGVCIGADREAHKIACDLGSRIVGHPPAFRDKMAAGLVFTELRKPFRYLTRNRHIVRDGVDGLIATPKDYIDKAGKPGEGTWTTVGYARQANRRIWVVYPDGTINEEHDEHVV